MTEQRKRGRPPGIPNPNAGAPRKGTERRDATTVHLDPDLRTLVQWHANARGQSVSESVNQLLAEALRPKEIDAEAKEVY